MTYYYKNIVSITFFFQKKPHQFQKHIFFNDFYFHKIFLKFSKKFQTEKRISKEKRTKKPFRNKTISNKNIFENNLFSILQS